MTAIAIDAIAAGFANPVHDSQGMFRAVLEAMSRPGLTVDTGFELPRPPSPLAGVAAGLALALCDHDTTVWCDAAADDANVVDYLRFHCGAPIVADPAEADFALITRPLDMPELRAFNPGNAEYPDRSTTLIIQVAELRTDAGWRLQGPGIAGHLEFEAAPLPASFKAQLQDNHDRYPMGVDIVLASGRALAALPRSARPSED